MITSTESKWIIKIIETLLQPLEYSGNHRRKQWEKGWQQNVDEGSVIPRYFGKYPVVRKDGRFMSPDLSDPPFEYQQLVELEKDVFSRFLKDSEHVYEFGCGTGHNLTTLKHVNPGALLTGLDWAKSSVKSVKRLGFNGVRFNMFRPSKVDLHHGAVFTVAALEQLGTSFRPFVDYLMNQKPSICVHLEPIEELMDKDNLLDFLQLEYMKKRKYLSGFLTYLIEKEEEGNVEIIEASRNGVGSLFIEGYSLVVWKPKS